MTFANTPLEFKHNGEAAVGFLNGDSNDQFDFTTVYHIVKKFYVNRQMRFPLRYLRRREDYDAWEGFIENFKEALQRLTIKKG